MKKYLLYAVCLLCALPAAAQTPESPAEAPSSDLVLVDGQVIRLSKPPVFKGKGFEKYCQWILAHVQYPKDMESNEVLGTVRMKIIVETDGTVTVGEVLESPAKALSNAVKNAVEDSPKWTPGRMLDPASGVEVPVRVSYILPVEFKRKSEPLNGSLTGVWQSQRNPRTYGSN